MPDKKKTLRLALQQFGQGGDRNGLLRALSNGEEDGNLLLILQHELQTTDDPDLREMIDDTMWAITNDQRPLRRLSKKDLDRIEKGAAEAYGRLIGKVIPDLRELAGAIFTQATAPPPVNAVVAAIGLHAQQNAKVFSVSRDCVGEELRYLSIKCNECGGEAGNMGYIICPDCSNRARRALGERMLREKIREDIRNLPAEERRQIDVEATIANCIANLDNHVNLDRIPQGMVIDFMRENSGQYGCGNCNYEAVSDCECVSLIQVPNTWEDGWIVKGKHPATGDSFYAVLRVKELTKET